MSSSKWKKYRLGEIVDIKHGFAFKGEFFSDTPTDDLLLTPGNFRIGGGFKGDKFKYYNGEYPKEYILRVDDVIVTMTDLSKEGDTLGYSALVPRIESKRLLHNQRLGLLQFKRDDFDKYFIYWLLRTKPYQTFIVNSASGSTVKHTSPSRIQEYEFEAPDIFVQRRIADILSALDEKIELNRQTHATLEAIAQSIFREWFVEFRYPDPKGLLGNLASSQARESGESGSKSAGQTFRVSGMVESELGMIPKGWRVGKLGDIIEVKGGTTPSTKEEKYWNGEYYWATPKDLSNLNSPVLLDTERKITKDGVSQISSGILPEGTLLLSSRAPIGYLAISNIPVSINQGFIAINARETSNLFILHWLKESMETVISRANGSTFLEITKTNFKEIEIVIPDSATANRFEEIVSPIFEQIKNNEQQSATLASLRDALLPKLMSGEIEM